MPIQFKNFFFTVTLLLTSIIAQAAQAAEDINSHLNRYLIVTRTFSGNITVSPSDIPLAKSLQETLEISLMSSKSFAQLNEISGVESVQSFAQEKRVSRVDKRELLVWGIPDNFLTRAGFTTPSVQKTAKGSPIFVDSKTMRRLAWQTNDVKTLVYPLPPKYSEMSGTVIEFNSVLSEGAAGGKNLVLIPIEDMLRDSTPGVMNPRVLIKLKQSANVNEVKQKIESFLNNSAQPALKGSILQLTTLVTYDH